MEIDLWSDLERPVVQTPPPVSQGWADWAQLYRPDNIREVIGDRSQIKQVDSFVRGFRGETKVSEPNLLLAGEMGLGKRLITDLIIRRHGFQRIDYRPAEIDCAQIGKFGKPPTGSRAKIRPPTAMVTYYHRLCNNRRLEVDHRPPRRPALVVDGVDAPLSPKQKNCLLWLMIINNLQGRLPIIVLLSVKHIKVYPHLEREAKYPIPGSRAKRIAKITLTPCDPAVLAQYASTLWEKAGYQASPEICQGAAEHSQGDIRRLVQICQDLSAYANRQQQITEKGYEEYMTISREKDHDPGIFRDTEILFGSWVGIEQGQVIYDHNRHTNPLMVHENFPVYVSSAYPRIGRLEQVEMMLRVSESISRSDKVDALKYARQCWAYKTIHGFYSCTLPSYELNRRPGKQPVQRTPIYTQDFNKSCIIKIIQGVIRGVSVNPLLKLFTIDDLLTASSLFKIAADQNRYDILHELTVRHGLTVKQIQSVVRIDKIRQSQVTIGSSQMAAIRSLEDSDDEDD